MRVLVVGQFDRAEMQPIMEWLRVRIAADQLRTIPAISLLTVDPSWYPELIVFLESHPDEFTVADVNHCFAFAPTSRIVCCAGVLSEAAGRTRKIWPLALRVPAVSAIKKLEREWALMDRSASGPLAPAAGEWVRVRRPMHAEASTPPPFLPPTGSREEWFAAHHPVIPNRESKGLTVRVVSPDGVYREMLADQLRAAGVELATQNVTAQVTLWDADPWSSFRAEEVREIAKSSCVIAVGGWITQEFESQLRQLGADRVLPKLGNQESLLEALLARIPD